MSATTTSRTHQPWCLDHYTEDDHPEEGGWCHHTLLDERGDESRQRLEVSIQPRLHDETDPGIDFYSDDKLSADEARRMAAALLRAADVLEASR